MAAVSVVVAEYDPAWPERFARYAASLREALGDRASRIDHIGSTAVPGLAAKDVFDIQVSVTGFEPFEPLRASIEGLGFEWIPDNDDRRKRFFRLVGAGDRRLANIHVRNLGEFSEQAALLFRDYLRATPEARHRYEETKRTLATRTWAERRRLRRCEGRLRLDAHPRSGPLGVGRCLGRRPIRRLATKDVIDI